MKRIAFILAGLLGAQASMAQDAAADSTGLPGDDLSLPGVLGLFSAAKDLESFEKALNTADNKVNNLDLDGNGEVDYIRVVDVGKGDVHVIALRVPVSKEESQDVAVIEVEKTGDQSARALIRGDVLLYGDSVLLEPTAEVMKQAKGAGGPDIGEAYPVYVWVNVWSWPCVSWMYGPSYVWWDSPWYWGYYPGWYSPWRPWGWNTWWGYRHHYHGWCRPVYYNEPTYASVVYAPRRSMSARVVSNTRPVREARAASGARSPYLGRERASLTDRRDVRPADGRQVQRPVQRPATRERGRQDDIQQRPSGDRGGTREARPGTDRQGGREARPNIERNDRSKDREVRPSRERRPSRDVSPSRRAPQPSTRPSGPSRQPSAPSSPSRSTPRRGR